MLKQTLAAQTITCATAFRHQDITFSDVRNAITGSVHAIQTTISPCPVTATAAYYTAFAYPNGDDASHIVDFNPHCESVDVKSFAAANQLTVTLCLASEKDTHPNEQSLRVLVHYRRGVNKLTVSVCADQRDITTSKACIEAIYTGICKFLPDMNTIKREELQVA